MDTQAEQTEIPTVSLKILASFTIDHCLPNREHQRELICLGKRPLGFFFICFVV